MIKKNHFSLSPRIPAFDFYHNKREEKLTVAKRATNVRGKRKIKFFDWMKREFFYEFNSQAQKKVSMNAKIDEDEGEAKKGKLSQVYGCKNNVIPIQFPHSNQYWFFHTPYTRPFAMSTTTSMGIVIVCTLGDKIELFSLSFNDTCLKWINIYILFFNRMILPIIFIHSLVVVFFFLFS